MPKPEKTPPSAKPSGIFAFWAELRRRKVVRVAIAYAVVAWLVMQVAGLTFEGFGVPSWAFRFVVIVLWLFFPVALLLAWAFELTPDGIKTAKRDPGEGAGNSISGNSLLSRNWLSAIFAAAAPTLIFGSLAAYFYLTRSLGENDLEKSIAVLPLANLSPDAENAFFADGVHEDILTNLSKVEELLVISRTSTLGYRDTSKNLKQIGEELGVRYLVEGSVRRAGQRVMVTAQLIDTKTDAHLWAENFNRSLDDIFAIQAEIAKTIAAQLHAVISPQALELIERRPTDNQEAYDNFLKYRELVETTSGVRWIEKIEQLERVVALDPLFAEAWASLAVDCYLEYGLGDNADRQRYLRLADQALDKAIALKPDLPDIPHAQSFQAWIKDGRNEASIAYLLEALATDPGFYNAHRMLGQHYYFLGRLTESLYHLEQQYRRDPLSPWTNELLFWNYLAQSLWNKADSLAELNTQRSASPEIWKWRLAYKNYLQMGDLNAYVDALNGIRSQGTSADTQLRHALAARDFSNAVQLLQGNEWPNTLEFLAARTGDLLPPKTLISLLQFEAGKQQDSLRLAQSELSHLLRFAEQERYFLAPKLIALIALHYALSDDPAAMEASIARYRANEEPAFGSYGSGKECELYIAIAYLVSGERQKALATLEAASQMDGPIHLARELDLYFVFDRLRGDPRFNALLEDG